MRKSVPATKGSVKKVDYEYRRKGVLNFFMMFEPLAGVRHVEVTDSRTRVDFTHCIRKLVDEYYPDAKKIVLVIDNLNIHSIASLYEAYEPAEALRLAKKLEIHHTPKHGSWLNMAEIEIGVMSRKCLKSYLPSKDFVISQVEAWRSNRNTKKIRAVSSRLCK